MCSLSQHNVQSDGSNPAHSISTRISQANRSVTSKSSTLLICRVQSISDSLPPNQAVRCVHTELVYPETMQHQPLGATSTMHTFYTACSPHCMSGFDFEQCKQLMHTCAPADPNQMCSTCLPIPTASYSGTSVSEHLVFQDNCRNEATLSQIWFIHIITYTQHTSDHLRMEALSSVPEGGGDV
eukprot:scpid104167/ scgid11961/ 